MKTSKKIIWALSLSLISIYPTFAKDCADIPIFKRHLELDACNLERRIDDRFEELTDVKIIHFRYRPYSQFLVRTLLQKDRLGLLVFSATYKGETLRFRCPRVYIRHDKENFSRGDFMLSMHNCSRGNLVLGDGSIHFFYSTNIAKESWLEDDKTAIR